MNIQAPIAAALLDMALLNEHQESVLSIGTGAQSLSLEIRNLTDHDIQLGGEHGTTLSLTFRPGALQQLDGLTATGNGWTGELDGGQVFPSLVLTNPASVVVGPGDAHTVVLSGLVPSPSGGSRSTRVDVQYSDVHLVGEGLVSGRRIVHLSLLHPSVGSGMTAGSFATSGPFEATITSSGDVVTGGTLNQIEVLLAATAPTDVSTLERAGVVSDEVSRFTFSTPEAPGDSLTFASNPTPIGGGGWTASGDVISYAQVRAKRLDGDFLRVTLNITTNQEPGLYPLYIDHENFGDRRGRLVLLMNVTAIGVPGLGGKIVAGRRLGDLSADSLAIGATSSSNASVTSALAAAPLSVSANVGAAANGVEFRHTNGTQGIGFGYNTIYATGSNTDQALTLKARGASGVQIAPGSGNARLNVDPGGIGLNADDIYCGGQFGKTRLNVNGPTGAARTVEIVGRRGDNDFLAVLDPAGKLVHNTTAWGFEVQGGRNAAKPGGGSWAVLSDRRLKKDIAPLRGALERLLRLRSVSFEYRDPSAINEERGERVGFLADEVEQVFPEWVGERADGLKYVSVKGFESLAVAALGELRREKDEQIAALERTVATLEAQLGLFRPASDAPG